MSKAFEYLSPVAVPAGGCSRCGGEYSLLDLGITGNPFILGIVTLCGTCLGELVGALRLIGIDRADAEKAVLEAQIDVLQGQVLTLEGKLAVAAADVEDAKHAVIPYEFIQEFTDGISSLAADLAVRVHDSTAARRDTVPELPAAPVEPTPPAVAERVPEPADDVDGGGDEESGGGDDEPAPAAVAAADVFAFLQQLGVDPGARAGADDAGVEGPDGVPGVDGGERNSVE